MSRRRGDCLVCYMGLGCRSQASTIRIKGKTYRTTRIMMHLLTDFPLDSELQVLHNDEICKSKVCIEFSHMRIGKHHENMRDARIKHGHNRLGSRKLHYKRGHLKVNGRCKVCREEIWA